MHMNSQLQNILHREMSRKEFLAIVGLGLCSLFGVSTIVRLLTASGSSAENKSLLGYSSGDYGGPNRADQQ
jgi:hypothetical protein